MEANAWTLFQHPLFEEQLLRLAAEVARLAAAQPETYKENPATKLLATIHRYTTEVIPHNPGAAEFRPRRTLGPDNRRWLRAKLHQRFHLFFRCARKSNVIVYVWVADESALQKENSTSLAYPTFKAMLFAGEVPQSVEALMKDRRGTKNRPSVSDG